MPHAALAPSAAGRSPTRAAAYARWVVRLRWWVVVFWSAALAGMWVLVPHSGGDELSSLIPLDSPVIATEIRQIEQFGFPLSSRTVVVQRDPEGLSPFVQAESVLDAIAVNQSPSEPPLLGAVPLPNSLPLGAAPNETGTAVLTYLFMDPGSSFFAQQRAAERYVAENLERPEDHVVGVAGSVPARHQQATIVTQRLPWLELFTVLAIFVLVAVNFRSVLAPVLALTASAVAFLMTVNLTQVVGDLIGVGAPAELEPLLVALLLGVVTDYTVFYVSALRSRLRAGMHWHQAVVDSVTQYTPIVVAAGLTVAAGTAALLAASSAFFRGFGPAMAVAVLVGLLVSVTLVPALMACIGPRLFWPSRPTASGSTDATDRRRAPRRFELARYLTRRPVAAVVLVGCLGVLVTASLPLSNIALGLGFTSSLSEDNPVSRASVAGATAFSPGITSPTTLLLEGKGVTQQLPALSRLQERVAEQPGVAGVIGPAQNFAQRDLGIVLAPSGDAARMLVIMESSPLDAAAIRNLSSLTAQLDDLAAASGLEGVRIGVAGDTALAQGLVGRTGQDLVRIGIAALMVNLLVLIVFLRALVAPVYLLASSVLALTASLGLTVWLFMDQLGAESLTFYVPFAAAVLLVALGSDYNIFGVGHVWDVARRMPLRAAIRTAVPETTRAIITAGVVLAVSFGMLAIIPLAPFRELAFAMSVGILIDVLVVRSLLVPCLLTLVGPASAWPSRQLQEANRSSG